MLQVHGKKHVMHIVYGTHTQAYLGMHKKPHVHANRRHGNRIMQKPGSHFPVQCSVFLYQCICVSPCPAVLPGAYAKPYGLRHLTDVWQMCALTHCQGAVPILIRHDSLPLPSCLFISLLSPPRSLCALSLSLCVSWFKQSQTTSSTNAFISVNEIQTEPFFLSLCFFFFFSFFWLFSMLSPVLFCSSAFHPSH